MKNKNQTLKLVMVAMLLGLTIVLQAISITNPITATPLAMSFIPIAVGAILYGPKCGTFLGFLWSVFILVSGQASFYMGMNVVGTLITVIVKGTLAGYLSGVLYLLLKKKNNTVAMIVAALACPIINSLIYRIGIVTFFHDYFLGNVDKSGKSPISYFIGWFLAGSFLIEVGISTVLSPVVVRICNIGRKMLNLEEGHE